MKMKVPTICEIEEEKAFSVDHKQFYEKWMRDEVSAISMSRARTVLCTATLRSTECRKS